MSNNYTYGFFDNQTIGVDDLNKITADVVSGGVSAVYSENTFSATEINDSNAALYTGGVVPQTDTCLKVIKSNDKYIINPGVAFFDDGTKMEILAGGEEITVTSGSVNYVYLVSDSNAMKCYVDVTQTEKTDSSGQYVYLASIDAEGNITDKRTYAAGKMQGFYAGTLGMPVSITHTIEPSFYMTGEQLKVYIGENRVYNNVFMYIGGTGSYSMSYLTFDDSGSLTSSKSMVVFKGGVYSENYIYGAFSDNLYYPNYNFDKSSIEIKDGYFCASLAMNNENKNPDYDSVIQFKMW